jgi:hypothetical protein
MLKLEVQDLPPPLLEFGADGQYTDPKVGLEQAGPFSLRFGSAHKSQIRIGMVGTSEQIEQAEAWFSRCHQLIVSDHANRAMYPDFPGFHDVFRSTLELGARWHVTLDSVEVNTSLKLPPQERFPAILNLYSRGLERLANGDVRPDVTVCCLPGDVVQASGTIDRVLTAQERREIHRSQSGPSVQMSLFPDWEPTEVEENLLHRDFRRALKARAMGYRMPIQLGTARLFLDREASQDPATRAWNVCLALFYKAGGIPWRLRAVGPETCFVGIRFHHLQTTHRHLVYSSVAQAFPTDGEGFALRGDALPWNPNQGRQVHLSDSQAFKLADEVLREYRDRTGGVPPRVVLHKTSTFDTPERSGFSEALHQVPLLEFVNLQPTSFRLIRDGIYPPARGMFCRVNEDAVFLYTTGYIPEWGTYPGPHIPAPIQLVCGENSDILRVASDVLGLSRMNWNTARDTSGIPITIRFAREVGGIMADVGPNTRPNPSYRYYM